MMKHVFVCSFHSRFHFPQIEIHAIPYFLVGIICGRHQGSFAIRDHSRSNLRIICGPVDRFGEVSWKGFCMWSSVVAKRRLVVISRFAKQTILKIELYNCAFIFLN